MRPPQDASSPHTGSTTTVTGAVERFEEAWQQAPPEPDLAAFLPPGPARRAALLELAHIDLVYRLKAGQAARVEDYLRRFPELGDDEIVLSDLIAAEYRLRVRGEPGLGAIEYLARFPQCREAIQARLPSTADVPSTIRTSPPAPAVPSTRNSSPPNTDTSGARLPLFEPAGRYELGQVIGRGGMGEVLRARDPQLGRELAVKILRGDGYRHPELLRRFVEEAQVCSQLQHPAIVPVHDLGTLPDGRPFFAMKLVKGRTLAALLRERGGPADDLPRYLAIFEQVCQAVGYAHSRGVIHRDLKPANVMVGNFGEVQVMDWGLAKVLRPQDGAPAGEEEPASVIRTIRSAAADASRVGQAMGTPAYMAPEQARGEVDSLDERCDVFGLGAILCEILTGAPPFTGGSANEAYARAARADLDDAFARLDGCGAEAELVRLAKGCLAARAESRPRDGGAVAATVTAYRGSVQERLRQAELERAAERARAEAAQARARAERRARRVTAGLAMAMVAVVVLLAAGGLWWQRHQAAVRHDMGARMEQAVRFRQSDQFEEGLKLLEQAREQLGEGSPDDLRQQVDQAFAEMGFAKRLDDARQRVLIIVEGSKLNVAGAEEEFAAALRDAGLGWDTGDAEVVAARVRASAVREEIVAALDSWASIVPDGPRRTWLLAVSRGADPDPLRDRLRQPGLWRDKTAVARLAAETRVAQLSPQLAATLGQAVFVSGGDAAPLLREAQAYHPNDFWLNALLGTTLSQAKELDEAIGYFRAALARRPRSAVIHNDLGKALYEKGRRDEAVHHWEEAIRIDPKFAVAHSNLGVASADRGKPDEAIRHYEEALRLDPKNAAAHNNLGTALKGMGRTDEAIQQYEAVLRLEPNFALAHYNLGVAFGEKGKADQAARHYQEALRINSKLPQAHTNLGVILYGKGKPDEAIRHYEEALRLDPKLPQAHASLGQALQAKGRHDDAIRHLEESLRIDRNSPLAHVHLGVALLNKGKPDEAIRHYEEALRLDPKDAVAYAQLGIALSVQGKLNEAVQRYEKAIGLNPNLWLAHVALSLTLRQQGRWAEARNATRRCLDVLPERDPQRVTLTQQLQLCDRMLALEARLPAVLMGTDRPASVAERLDFAGICLAKKRYVAAARLYGDSLAATPGIADDLGAGYRYSAARCAVLAAAGLGADSPKPDNEARGRLRRQALGWLGADLAARAKQLTSWWPGAREQAKTALRHWQQDPDLAGVRDKQALAALPAEERAEWEKLWAEVADLLRRLDAKATAPAGK
jgi:serine/threonine-protein kinase